MDIIPMAMTPWLDIARSWIGVQEIPGPKSDSRIKDLWLALKNGRWFWQTYGDDSSLPWCGAFIAHCMQSAGIDYPASYASARSWTTWGSALANPAVGCVVVFQRDGGGHVGFVVGRDAAGHLMVLGGNQGDAVSVKPFARDRVIAYRWPTAAPMPAAAALPILVAHSEVSTNEA